MSTHQASLTTDSTDLRLTRAEVCPLLEERRLLDPHLALPQLWLECEIAADLQLAALVCRVDQVLPAAQALKESSVAVGTVLGFAQPDTTLSGILAEARRAVRMGAREVAVIIHTERLRHGDLGELRRDLSQISGVTSSGGARLRVVMHTGELTPAQIAAGCMVSQEAGAAMVVGGSWFAAAQTSLPELRIMRASVEPGDPGQGGGPGAHPRHAAAPARAGAGPVRRRQPPPRARRGVRAHRLTTRAPGIRWCRTGPGRQAAPEAALPRLRPEGAPR